MRFLILPAAEAVLAARSTGWALVVLLAPMRSTADVTRVGPRMEIAAEKTGTFWPAASFHAAANRFLALRVDVNDAHGWQLKGRPLDADSGAAGPEFHVSPDPSRIRAGDGSAVYNPTTREWLNEFLVVWLDYRHWPGEGQDNGWGDTYGQRIDASSGSTIGPNIAVFAGKNVRDGQDSPNSIACGARDGNYAVGITRLMPGGAKVKGWVTLGTVIRPDGAPVAPRIDLSYPKIGPNVSTVYNPVDNSFVMSYDNNRPHSPRPSLGRGAPAGCCGDDPASRRTAGVRWPFVRETA